MGWFDEQIRQRMESDQDLFEESFVRVAGSVLGSRVAQMLQDDRLIAKEAIDEIQKYYHRKPTEIPDTIENADEQLDYALRPHGIMSRAVTLEDGWYRDAFGPMLAFLKEEGTPVALLPNLMHGYHFRDPQTGRTVSINRKTAMLLRREAICFYYPLPMKKIGIPDLLLFMKDSVSVSDFVWIFLATLAVTLFGMIEPQAYKALVGPVLETKSYSMLAGMAVFVLCAAFSSQLIGTVKTLLMGRISAKTSLSVDSAVMMRILSLPVSFFRKFSAGELSSRVDSVNTLCQAMLGNILSTGLSSLLSLLYITQIFAYTPVLVWPSVLIILITVVLNAVISLLRIRISKKRMNLSAQVSGTSYAVISGVQKIKLAGAEKRAFARWAKPFSARSELDYNPPAILKLNGVILLAVSLIGNVVLYYLAVQSRITPADYTAFTAAYGRLMGAFSAMAGIVISIAELSPALEMAEPILNAEPEISENKEMLTKLSGNIEINHVFFRYNDDTPYVLKDLSLKIRPGEYVAIVGRTGCGKSTLMRLLLGFEKPQRGAIYYDGKDLKSLDPKSLRKKMGVVTQNGQLFAGDIFSNITISAPQLTLDEAWEAAEIAGIAEDIRRMPMGMNTLVSEGQGGISGGQKQRIMIARAVAPKPNILMLDEATSALDNKTQKQVADALDRLKCTRIVIAHRLSTIRNCDRILVMDQGRIIENGTYEELIVQNGAFAELVARQRLDREPETKFVQNEKADGRGGTD